MKNRINPVLGALLLGLSLSACQDYFEIKPKNFIPSEKEQFATIDGANRMLMGVYYTLNNRSLYGRDLINTLDLFSNDLVFNNQTTPRGLACWDHNASDGTITEMWSNLYQAIDRANLFIDNIHLTPGLKEEERNGMIGQVRFIRALLHYNLGQNWGNVPLKLTQTLSPQQTHTPPSPYTEVFKAIHDDLDLSIQYLPERSSYSSAEQSGRPSITTAIALKARTYLRQAGEPFNIDPKESYRKAAEAANQLIAGDYAGTHKLNPSYYDLFVNLIQDKYDNVYNENLMEIEFAFNDARKNSSAYGNVGVPFKDKINGSEIIMSGGAVRATKKLLQLFPVRDSVKLVGIITTHHAVPVDMRRNWNTCDYSSLTGNIYGGTPKEIKMVGDPNKPDSKTDKYLIANPSPELMPTGRFFGKFRREYEPAAALLLGSPTNFPLIRYAEVLLIFAEADVRAKGSVSDEALEALNIVRRRAYFSYANTDRKKDFDTEFKFTNTNPATFLKEIQNERARELVGEGHRRHDLIRWGILIPTMQEVGQSGDPSTAPWIQKVDNEKYYLLPYPENEIARNNEMKGKQNPGW